LADRDDALLDLGFHRVHRRVVEAEQMVLAVGANGVAFGANAPGQIGVAAGHPADQEIVSLHAILRQHVKHPVGVGRQRAVVEGQHDLLVLERQRLAVVHGADAGKLPGIDLHHPAGAERVRIAWAVGGARLRRRERDQHQCDQTEGAPTAPSHEGCADLCEASGTKASGGGDAAARRELSGFIFKGRP
jgi:hypothetical protein